MRRILSRLTAGGVGQPLSLLLKSSPFVERLALYDIANARGVAVDLSHINTKTVVTAHGPQGDGLRMALQDANIVFITAGVAQKVISYSLSLAQKVNDSFSLACLAKVYLFLIKQRALDLFDSNAIIAEGLAKAIARTCRNAFILVITNPVNSIVPVIAEILKSEDAFNPQRLFGVTTLDVIRSSAFVAEAFPSLAGSDIVVPVIGGHSNKTIIPLFSQSSPHLVGADETTLASLSTRVQLAGDEVIKAKNGTGSATLCMAYAGYKSLFACPSLTLGSRRRYCGQ